MSNREARRAAAAAARAQAAKAKAAKRAEARAQARAGANANIPFGVFTWSDTTDKRQFQADYDADVLEATPAIWAVLAGRNPAAAIAVLVAVLADYSAGLVASDPRTAPRADAFCQAQGEILRGRLLARMREGLAARAELAE